MTVALLHGDCLALLPTLAPASVDLILSDWPYGTTACAWDSVIPLAPLWAEIRRVLKPRGAVVLTASQPFTSILICSNLDWFKYTWVWEKTIAGGFLSAKNRPLKAHEDICVFSPGTVANRSPRRMIYNPQVDYSKPSWRASTGAHPERQFDGSHGDGVFRRGNRTSYAPFTVRTGQGRQPRTVIQFSNGNYNSLHPTQKPLALFEYLMRTYSNPGDVVLDNAFGSCTTGEAAIRLQRDFIGMEQDAGYFAIGAARCAAAQAAYQPALFAEAGA